MKTSSNARRLMLMAATASSLILAVVPADAEPSDTQMQAVERQIQALKTELQAIRQQNALRERQLRTIRKTQSATMVTPPAGQPIAIVPQIPTGYALVPASPGSRSGSVVLARVEQPKAAPTHIGTFQVGAATVTLGGFLTADMVFRSRNSVSDIQSNYIAGMPERYQPQYHETEYHLGSRLSRLTGLVSANPDESTKLRAYVSADFEGGAPTSNYNESNSWVPRLREAWASYDRSDLGFEILGGQAWSLLTMNRIGTDPLNVNPPSNVDATSQPGFTWARQPQIRFLKTFDNRRYQLAVSFENPATIYGGAAVPSTLGTLNVSNPGVGIDGTGSNSTTSVISSVTTVGGKTTTSSVSVLTPGSITNDIAPDMIVKGTADFSRAHLEAYAIGRVIHDRLSQSGTGQSNTQFGGGAGGAALIRLIPKFLDFQVSGLAGQGISRYDSSQLPDATVGSHGQPVVLPAWQALVGLTGHPTPSLDIYGLLGTAQVSARYFDTGAGKTLKGYGYGNPLFDNAGCGIELSPASTCAANSTGIVQGSVGAWYRFFKGPYGTMQVGLQYAYARRFVAQGYGPTPQTDNNNFFLSFRYFPFQ